jgi:endonuclease YncB( thermonuclease family)
MGSRTINRPSDLGSTTPWWLWRAEVTNAVDGDTYDLRLDLGFSISARQRIRLKDVDTHEIYGVEGDSDEYERGMEELAFAMGWLKSARTNHTADDYPFVLYTTSETGKYGRYLGDVYARATDAWLTDALVNEYPDVRRSG